jgi:hypothetical protein
MYQPSGKDCTYFEHGKLFSEAERLSEEGNCISAVILSVASLESLVNSIGDIATTNSSTLQPIPDTVRFSLRAMSLSLRTSEKDTLKKKIELVNFFMYENSVAWGAKPFQDLDILIKLRNQIIHQKPSKGLDAITELSGVLRFLDSRNLLEPRVNTISPKSMLWDNSQVAAWAYQVAVDCERKLCGNLPKSWPVAMHILLRSNSWPEMRENGS